MTNNIWSTSVGWSWVVNCDGDMQARKCTKMDLKRIHESTCTYVINHIWRAMVKNSRLLKGHML